MTEPLVVREGWLRHERALINLYARPLPNPHPRGKNLWNEIGKFEERYVVDNHIPWTQYADRKDFAKTAFILGTTALNEKAQLISIYERPGGTLRSHRNVFLFHGRDFKWHEDGRMLNGLLVIDRLDDTISSLDDRNKVLVFGDHRILKNPRDESPRETQRLTEFMRAELLNLLVKRADLQPTTPPLLEQIQEGLGQCFGNYRRSIDVARLCYAQLLTRSSRAVQNFLKKGSVNGFLDAGLIKDALFFNALILTQDAGVREMANYCGIKTFKELTK